MIVVGRSCENVDQGASLVVEAVCLQKLAGALASVVQTYAFIKEEAASAGAGAGAASAGAAAGAAARSAGAAATNAAAASGAGAAARVCCSRWIFAAATEHC